jgi:hypothetical protein
MSKLRNEFLPKKWKCIVCGKPGTAIYKFKYGKVCLCSNHVCQRLFSLRVEGSLPVVWVGDEDIVGHLYLSKEFLNKVPDELKIQAYYEGAEDTLWEEQDFGRKFDSACREAALRLEYLYIMNCPRSDLPLLIGTLHFKENDANLKRRIQGDTTNETQLSR